MGYRVSGVAHLPGNPQHLVELGFKSLKQISDVRNFLVGLEFKGYRRFGRLNDTE